jgi:predicted DNA-binding transcriptional regulator YafY
VEDHEDGSMTLSLKVEGLDEIKRWIMQYGSHMEVIEPEDFKREIIDEIDKMRKNYEE